VRVRGSDGSAITDPAGSFSLGSMPTGTHALEAAAIGFQPLRVAVDITDGDFESPPANLVLHPAGPVLDTMRVFGKRDLGAPWQAQFDMRRKLGLGRFLDEAAIEKRDPMTVTDLMSSIPGLTIRSGNYSSRSTVMMRSAKGGYCIPAYVIDGIPTNVGDASIDWFVSARQVRGVELYRSENLTPSEFPRSRCGTIVIWTGMRAGK
jgi:hypothetical protein